MRGYELGLDSLISVDIRSWFLKNFLANIPVLKIMANDVQMNSLAQLAAESIPGSLIPGVSSRSAPTHSSNGTSQSSAVGSRLGTQATSPATTLSTPASSVDDAAYENNDWKAETAVPENIEHTKLGRKVSEPPKVVMLTGVSGLLGHHLLNHLLEQQSIEKVICVAVRRLSERVEKGDIPPASQRVTYYDGDLRDRYFGLPEAEAHKIFDEVDAIIHNGSDTSHLKFYSALRDANAKSTRQILEFAIPRHIPIHYVSSAGIALFAGMDAFPEISATLTGTLPPADGAHGYMCGKVRYIKLFMELTGTNLLHSGSMSALWRKSMLVMASKSVFIDLLQLSVRATMLQPREPNSIGLMRSSTTLTALRRCQRSCIAVVHSTLCTFKMSARISSASSSTAI
jgi:hypothetical protein